jgi:hypothetical protein
MTPSLFKDGDDKKRRLFRNSKDVNNRAYIALSVIPSVCGNPDSLIKTEGGSGFPHTLGMTTVRGFYTKKHPSREVVMGVDVVYSLSFGKIPSV